MIMPRILQQRRRPTCVAAVSCRGLTVLLAVVALLVGCHDLDRPTAAELPGDLSAAAHATDLTAPSNASAHASSVSRVDLSWLDYSASETGFEVHRSVTASGALVLVATTGAGVVSYSDEGLVSATEYCYRVRAVRQSGNRSAYSAFSNTACAVTLAPPSPPAPSNAAAVALSETQIDLGWQDNSTDETRFEIHRSASGPSGAFALLSTSGANVQNYRDAGLAPATEYCYRVRAVRQSGSNYAFSAFSNTACAVTLTPPPPGAASGTTAVPLSSGSVSVRWMDNSSSADGFRIERSIDGGTVWEQAGTVDADSSSRDTPAVAEQPVCYRVVAFNVGGEAPPSNTACTTPPAGPTNLTATRVDSETVDLAWNDNSAVEDGYQVWLVWYRTSMGCYPPGYEGTVDSGYSEGEVMLAELPANAVTYRMTFAGDSCEPPTYYWVYVVATKDGGRSSGAAQGL